MQQAAKQDADACFAEAVGPGGIARATAAMLTDAGCPVRRLSVAAADAGAMGAPMTHFMLVSCS